MKNWDKILQLSGLLSLEIIRLSKSVNQQPLETPIGTIIVAPSFQETNMIRSQMTLEEQASLTIKRILVVVPTSSRINKKKKVLKLYSFYTQVLPISSSKIAVVVIVLVLLENYLINYTLTPNSSMKPWIP